MIRDELRPMESVADPEIAVQRLEALHAGAIESLRAALARYLDGGPPPMPPRGCSSAIPSCG